MYFQVLTVNTKDIKLTLDKMNEIVRKIVSDVLPATYIDYATFKKSTESKPIPLYIMDRKNEERNAMIVDVSSMKKSFVSKAKVGDYTAPLDQSFNPRFMILDTHDINDVDGKESFAIRIMMNANLPISHSMLLDAAAKRVSAQGLIATVFVVGQELNAKIEYVGRWENSRRVLGDMKPNGSGLIGKYTAEARISVNKMLSMMDNNIDKLMAPRDLVELEALLAAHVSSKEFMDNNGLSDTPEYHETTAQIKEVKEDVAKCHNLTKDDPKVISNYIKIYDPRQLEKYKVRELNLNSGMQSEVWS